MRNSLLLPACFLAGIVLSHEGVVDCPPADASTYLLYVLLFIVGVGIGVDRRLQLLINGLNPVLFLLPIVSVAGTLIACGLTSLALPHIGLSDSLAVGSGMGYYSLSSVLIARIKLDTCGVEVAATLGALALLTNVAREMVAIVGAGAIARIGGPLAPIAAAGSPSMDVVLPTIVRVSGVSFLPLALFHGMAIDFCLPFLVSLIAGW